MIYLIHFDHKVGGHAAHYLGYTADLDDRLDRHRRGNGSRLMAEVARLGIGWQVARLWRGSRADERRLKNRKNHARLCPVCNPRTWPRNASHGDLGLPDPRLAHHPSLTT